MGLLDRRGKGRPEGGIEGKALIRESNRSGKAFGQFSDFEQLNRFGTRTYRLVLEVRIPDHDPYEVEGKFEVPRKAENTGLLAGGVGNPLRPGLELPVRVDAADSTSIEIDWERYLKTPGRKQAQRSATQSARNRQMAEQLERNPKLAEKARAGNRVAAQSWAAAVKGGKMSREEFEQTVSLEVETGRMDPADAEAARATLDG
jgi:hypothetical protein